MLYMKMIAVNMEIFHLPLTFLLNSLFNENYYFPYIFFMIEKNI